MRQLIALSLMAAMAVWTFGPGFAGATGDTDPNTSADSQTIGTGFDRSSGGGYAPVVKAKWEMNRDKSGTNAAAAGNENGLDDMPYAGYPGAQFLPSGEWGVDKGIWVCGIVTDPDGLSDITEGGAVYADIFYPDDRAFHYLSDDLDYGENGCGQQVNYEIQLEHQLTKEDGIELFCDKIRNNNESLPTFNEPYFDGLVAGDATREQMYQEICNVDGELQKQTAAVFCKYTDISFEDPAGDYTTQVHAVDKAGVDSDPLINDFEYLPVTAFETDFDSVNYGSVKLNTHKIINGDIKWDDLNTGLPSVRNTGNTRLNMTIFQDDMGLGQTTDGSTTWNVQWDARVGSDAPFSVYDPYQMDVELEDILDLSEIEEMDFSIKVFKFPYSSENYTGEMTLGAQSAEFRMCDSGLLIDVEDKAHNGDFGNGWRYEGAFIRPELSIN